MSRLPTTIGRYQIKSLLGRGGMGQLYLAHDPNTNRLVAVKLLNATIDSPELRARFEREADALAALNHPNIVIIHDKGEFEDSPFIVMEYIRGETLAEIIKRRATMSVAHKIKLMAQLCAGLAEAHGAGLVHRDIKPANLMVDQSGRLKILDFGIARVVEDNRTRVGLTVANTLIGTPGYMSPEQFDGGAVDHRSDLFSVGAVCYELLSYTPAFPGEDTTQIKRGVLAGKPAALASLVPSLDPDLDEIVLRALKSDPNKRFQDATTFERALERVRARVGPDAPASSHRPTPPPPSSARGQREARAEAAYRSAVASERDGAREAAKRFAIEVLVEAPTHERALALIARLEARAPRTAPSPALPPAAIPPTIVATSQDRSARTMSSAPTIVVDPTVVRTAHSRNRCQSLWSGAALSWRKFSERVRPPTVGAAKRRDRFWYAPVLQLAGVLGLVAVIVAVTYGATRVIWPSSHLLTIARPIGGTVSASGIRCGTGGADCTSSRPKDERVELKAEAESGYVLDSFTGDCAPSGRTTMSAPRTCGATFAPVVAVPKPATQILTISPVPTGGTLVGVDIKCGTDGSACAADYAEGLSVDLQAMADPTFTFMGFSGDCSATGRTQMIGPRTCSAAFSPTASLPKALPPPTPDRNHSTLGRSGRNAVPGSGGRGGDPSSASTGGQAAGGQSPAAPGTPGQGTGGSVGRSGSPAPVGGSGGRSEILRNDKDVRPPPPPEEVAKAQIAQVIKSYCAAWGSLDPDAVRKEQPGVDMKNVKSTMSNFKYLKEMCAAPEYESDESLDEQNGKANVRVGVKREFTRTVLSAGVEKDEQTLKIELYRSAPREPWKIRNARVAAK